MFEAIENPYLVPFDSSFHYPEAKTSPTPDAPDKKECKKRLKKYIGRIDKFQRVLYAHNKYALLLIFQAIDAAGKDSTIRAVMSGVNPTGCQTFSFKQPTPEELDHDFLWRTSKRLPERGRIGIFNRSYYEEVLVVRVHPEYLQGQNLPYPIDLNRIWQERYEAIVAHEQYQARNGLMILKFWLNVSKEEQRRRFLSRLDNPHKNWKFSERDIKERGFWDHYMHAFEDALNATSRPWAPWYAIPADNKPYMRMSVAKIIVKSLKSLNLEYPKVGPEDMEKFNNLCMSIE
ncbi:MAG: phosphate--nucleotide phosphotransferase [Candidatus Cloacimonetes bacterium 4572_55]|nr:MAG: phosphate--nucleotide phosphotransferase [Candidatus Cloacimonetes bacterium 4572_55]